MNREDIIRMAREAGLDPDLWNYTDAFERFAALVASAERDEIIKIAKDLYYWDDSESLIKTILARGQA